MAEAAKDRLIALLEPVLVEAGYELVDLEYRKESGRWVLRLFIDSPGGITLDDCEAVSHQVSGCLDESDPIPHQYALEVSSPGLERTLRKDSDFHRFQGSKVSVRTFAPLEGRRNFHGELGGMEDGLVLINEDGNLWRIPRAAISRAKLVADWDGEDHGR